MPKKTQDRTWKTDDSEGENGVSQQDRIEVQPVKSYFLETEINWILLKERISVLQKTQETGEAIHNVGKYIYRIYIYGKGLGSRVYKELQIDKKKTSYSIAI